MIYFGFNIRNPFSRRFGSAFYRFYDMSKHKTVEIECWKNNVILGVNFNITDFNQNHAGFDFNLSLLGYTISFNFYDNRHSTE